MHIPLSALWVLDTLTQHGHESYVVGGCVRDSLLGKTPSDWDICTSATPREMLEVFDKTDAKIIETGLKHGTLTILYRSMAVEVTTFRVDGPYRDNRRPSHVIFTGNLQADLSRRDFTINAMAYNSSRGLVDFFGGQQDLRLGILRCVGEPNARFDEDALRILRALRFASKLSFQLEASLAASIHQNKTRLANIAAERVFVELNGLLCGDSVQEILLEFADVIAVVLPEIPPMIGFLQHNPHHHLDVWGHTALAVANVPARKVLRLAMLFHDVGKPACYTQSEDGIGHFYAHAARSEAMATVALRRLRADNATIHAVTTLVKWHDTLLTEKLLPRRLNQLGKDALGDLLLIKRADISASTPDIHNTDLLLLDDLEKKLATLISQGQCFRTKDLAINGSDIIALGLAQGPQVGVVIQTLLDGVLDGTLANEKEILLRKAEALLQKP